MAAISFSNFYLLLTQLSDPKSKMAAMAGHRLPQDSKGKNIQTALFPKLRK